MAQDKLQVAEQYSWYIINALMIRVDQLKQVIAESEQSLEKDDGTAVYRAVRGMVSVAKQSLKDNEKALEALRKVGFT